MRSVPRERSESHVLLMKLSEYQGLTEAIIRNFHPLNYCLPPDAHLSFWIIYFLSQETAVQKEKIKESNQYNIFK